MIAVLAAATVGLLSAFLPFTPAEPYLIAAVATTGTPPVALGVAAAVGQTAGKVLIFLGARGAIRSTWLRRRHSRRTPGPRRWPKALARLVEVMERPRQAIGVLLVSAVTGFPPLLAVSVYLGRTPMRPLAFAAACLLGRTIRFVTIAFVPQLA
ncbi:MAG TPA: VTT domain-containing protein [Actinoplanes sp.]|nr:VTT domain-containing protein [Actinoplanes sp.]